MDYIGMKAEAIRELSQRKNDEQQVQSAGYFWAITRY